jgi:hypothetical protein
MHLITPACTGTLASQHLSCCNSSWLILHIPYCCHWSAGKRKSKGKSKGSAKDAAAAAEKRSSKVAAVASTKARGKPKKLGLMDHALNALPPQLSRWLRKHRKAITWGIAVVTFLVFCIMAWLSSLSNRQQDKESEAMRIQQQRLMQEQQMQHFQEQQRLMQEQHMRNMHGQHPQAAGPQYMP